jgi:hypothetical protein
MGTLKEYEGDVDAYLKLLGDPHVQNAPPPTEIPLKHAPAADDKPLVLSREEQKAIEREKRKAERRIAEIEKQIGVQEKMIADLEVILADPELYKDPVKQHKSTTSYETAKKVVASLTDEWATLMEVLS